MAGPNDPVLTWLRDLIASRGLNTAELARVSKLEKGRLKRVLSGSQPMLVDELMQISSALELSPADMGLPNLDEDADDDARPAPPPPRAADPYGNHPRQLFEAGFALGTTFYFAADVDALRESGVPDHVLEQHGPRNELIISLDAAYHRNNDPRIDDEGVTLTLSFDQVYDCTFAWSAVRRVVFDIDADDEPPEPDEEDDDEDTPPPGKTPHLRLVT